MMPGAFVSEAAARAATKGFDLGEGRLTPELFELFKTTFRGVYVVAYLKRQELVALNGLEDFERGRRNTPGVCRTRRSGWTMRRRKVEVRWAPTDGVFRHSSVWNLAGRLSSRRGTIRVAAPYPPLSERDVDVGRVSITRYAVRLQRRGRIDLNCMDAPEVVMAPREWN